MSKLIKQIKKEITEMKKVISVIICALMVMSVFTACSTGETATDDGAGKLALGGSTSVEAVIQSMMEVYMEQNDVSITYAPTGSSTGVAGAGDKTLDIGLSSRPLKDEEKATLTETVFALDGIAIIVNNANTVEDLSLSQLSAIYKGEVTNWSEVGGNDVEIVTIGRDSASGTRDGFESIVDVKDACLYAEEQASGGGVIASVQANEGAIGYTSVSSVSDSTKTLTIDGVAPSVDTIKDGSYQIQRPFVFATLTDGTNETAKAFMDWAISSETTQLVLDAGAIPVA